MVRIILFILITCLFFGLESSPAPQWFHFDTPRTGSKWPPYPNADKGFWSHQAEQLEEHVRVKKVANDPNTKQPSDKDNQIEKINQGVKVDTNIQKTTKNWPV